MNDGTKINHIRPHDCSPPPPFLVMPGDATETASCSCSASGSQMSRLLSEPPILFCIRLVGSIEIIELTALDIEYVFPFPPGSSLLVLFSLLLWFACTGGGGTGERGAVRDCTVVWKCEALLDWVGWACCFLYVCIMYLRIYVIWDVASR